MAYARGTTVSIARSKEEIERVLARYGADSFGYATEGNRALVTFSMESRRIRMFLELPEFEDFELTPTRLKRNAPAQRRAYEQGCRERWRSLALIVKAKLEAVATGITTLETEFLAHIVLPDGRTVGQFMLPQVDQAYRSGEMPPMLPAPT